MGKTLNDAYDKRLIENYGIGFIVTKGEAKEMLETAKNFVQTLKSYLKIWMEKEKNEQGSSFRNFSDYLVLMHLGNRQEFSSGLKLLFICSVR